MLACLLKSVDGGSLSHPVLGGAIPQMFLSKTISSVISNPAEVIDDGIAGYSFPHCVAFKIQEHELNIIQKLSNKCLLGGLN